MIVDARDHTDVMEEKVQLAIARRKLEFYEPYPKQLEFHASGAQFWAPDQLMKERLLCAGNQLGKCQVFQSVIEHPDGTTSTFGERYLEGRPFDVYAWDGEKVIVARATTPIKKPAEPCVRFWLVDGRSFGCALNHRVMLSSGAYVFCDSLLASLPNLLECSSERDLSIRVASARHWSRTRRGFLVGCLSGFRLYDEQLLRASNGVRSWLQRRAGVRGYSYASFALGGCPSKYTSTVLPEFSRPSNLGGEGHLADRCVGFLVRGVNRFSQRMRCYSRAVQRRLLGLIVRPQSNDVTSPGQSSTAAYETPFSIDGNRIVAYEPIPSQEVYDFTVPETKNYIACGLVHHNTMSAGAEVAYHLTGLYPSWWNGRRFNDAVSCWIAGPTSQMTRDNPQKMLMGEPGEWGTGMIPGRLMPADMIKRATHGVADAVESIMVKHVSGKWSRAQFKTYDQGRIRWQGSTIDFIWCDEEPPLDIYSEGMVRVQVKGGFIIMTFTPLLGMSEVVARFLQEKPLGSCVIKMGIADAKHYTEDQRRAIINSYPEHEREARANGEPIMGSGRVFPVPFESIVCQPIQIPAYWLRISGLDIGWEHPTAVVWLAWDRDTDTIYVYDEYRLKEQTPIVHAAAIKARGAWIPMAWPHDGHQHDAGSGKIIAEQYRKQGILMLPSHATHAPLSGKKEGTGGYSVEAGISDMLQRMQTGRWKVFSTCGSWKEEYNMYYRKEGLIVKKGDDLMSASRVANMMLRFAKIRLEKPNGPKLASYVPSDPSMGPLG